MPDSVVERVARHLDVSESQAVRLVHAVGELIQVLLTRDGIVHVPGIGVLKHTNGKIDLEPDDSLLSTVNAPFAGLEPVHFGPSDTDPTEVSKESASEPAPVGVPIQQARAPERVRKKAWRGPLLGVGALVLVVIGAVLIFRFGVPGQSTETALTEQASDPVSPAEEGADPVPEPVDPVAKSTDPALEPVDLAEGDAAEEDSEVTPSEPSVQRSLGGYTIVVASFGTEGPAMEVAQQHRARLAGTAVPVDIMRSVTQSGNIVFRVIVGQAPDIDGAVTLRDGGKLTGLPANAWITRIRPDS